jgi:hypothetical protein
LSQILISLFGSNEAIHNLVYEGITHCILSSIVLPFSFSSNFFKSTAHSYLNASDIITKTLSVFLDESIVSTSFS